MSNPDRLIPPCTAYRLETSSRLSPLEAVVAVAADRRITKETLFKILQMEEMPEKAEDQTPLAVAVAVAVTAVAVAAVAEITAGLAGVEALAEILK